MSIDVEDLLRRTYADVAERTTVEGRDDVTVVALSTVRDRRTSRWPLLAAAAVVALVVAGLVVLRRDGTDTAAPVDESTLVHVLPGALPDADGGVEFGSAPALPLIRIDTDAEHDVLEYASDDMSLEISVLRGAAVIDAPLGEPNTELADGTAARLTTSSGTALTWDRTPTMRVTVTMTGAPESTVRAVADALLYVDAAAWALATDHAGFASTSASDAGIVAEYDLDTETPLTLHVRGDLHAGFLVAAPSISTGWWSSPDRCEVNASGASLVVVRSPAPGRFLVRVTGMPPQELDVGTRVPGTNWYVDAFEYDPTPVTGSIRVACEEVGS